MMHVVSKFFLMQQWYSIIFNKFHGFEAASSVSLGNHFNQLSSIKIFATLKDFPMRRTLIVLGLAAFSSFTFAGEQSGTVQMDHGQHASGPTSAGHMFFFVHGAGKTNRPACNTYADRWVINNSWPAAKIQIAILLSAITSGKSVTVRGSGECSQWSDSETAIDIRINN